MRRRALRLLLCAALIATVLTGCGAGGAARGEDKLGNGWRPEQSLELRYAEQFGVDYYSGGLALLSIADGSRFLVVPEGGEVPAGIDPAITVLQQPVENIYLVATASMCLFDALGALDRIGLSGARAEDWQIENARAAMEAGEMLYAGKYNAPDYELILETGCGLAIESTMIHHAPAVGEMLEELGVPVLVDHSSYESHPLGRTEWIKLYAVLAGEEALAARLFDEQAAYLDALDGIEDTGKTVAFFYINSSGHAVARKPGDYVSKMIELAGGSYIFRELGDPETATSTAALEMEAFYATAKDADVVIYNSAVGGELASLDELVGMNPLLAEFRAVREGDVWCTGQNFYQETTQLGLTVSEMHRVLAGEAEGEALRFLYKLE